MKILGDRMLRIKVLPNIPVVDVQIYLHALPMNNNYATTRRTENAFEKRRLPASACVCLFSLESGVALSRTVLRTTLIQPGQTPTTQDINMHVKLKIVTLLSFSERLAIANLSFSFFCVEKSQFV